MFLEHIGVHGYPIRTIVSFYAAMTFNFKRIHLPKKQRTSFSSFPNSNAATEFHMTAKFASTPVTRKLMPPLIAANHRIADS